MFLAAFEGKTDKLILPEFQHVLQLSCPSTLGNINPQVVQMPGNVPLQYLLRIIKTLEVAHYTKPDTTGQWKFVKLNVHVYSMASMFNFVCFCLNHIKVPV